jgi:RNA polymerase sigma factor (TIGR02999 family)
MLRKSAWATARRKPHKIVRMSDVTRILKRIDDGDPTAPAQLLPLVYDELRRLAAGHMANESPGHTLNATALVHEAYLKLVVGDTANPTAVEFANRGHFFAAAAQAMRRILVDSARRKQSEKRGGGRLVDFDVAELKADAVDHDRWLDLDEAMDAFERVDSDAAALAKLRIFGGLTIDEAAEAMRLSRSTAHRLWTYSKAWLSDALADRG